MEAIEAVFFDLQSLLIPGGDILSLIKDLFSGGQDAISAGSDGKRILLPEKMSLKELERGFFDRVDLVNGVETTLEALSRKGVVSVLFSLAPIEVVQWFLGRFPFDHGIGGPPFVSQTNVGDDLWGKRASHPGEMIREFLFNRQLGSRQCLAVTGPGEQGHLQGLFERYLILVYSKEVFGKAGRHLYADNLAEVLKFV